MLKRGNILSWFYLSKFWPGLFWDSLKYRKRAANVRKVNKYYMLASQQKNDMQFKALNGFIIYLK